jgi:cysteine desulfurase
MAVPYAYAMGSIRFSLGRFNTAGEVERLVAVLPGVVDEVRKMAGWSTSGLTSAAS